MKRKVKPLETQENGRHQIKQEPYEHLSSKLTFIWLSSLADAHTHRW